SSSKAAPAAQPGFLLSCLNLNERFLTFLRLKWVGVRVFWGWIGESSKVGGSRLVPLVWGRRFASANRKAAVSRRNQNFKERYESPGAAGPQHPQRRAVCVLPHRLAQRASRHHRPLPLLRAHDVQRRQEIRSR